MPCWPYTCPKLPFTDKTCKHTKHSTCSPKARPRLMPPQLAATRHAPTISPTVPTVSPSMTVSKCITPFHRQHTTARTLPAHRPPMLLSTTWCFFELSCHSCVGAARPPERLRASVGLSCCHIVHPDIYPPVDCLLAANLVMPRPPDDSSGVAELRASWAIESSACFTQVEAGTTVYGLKLWTGRRIRA